VPVLEFLGILFSASHVVEVDSSEEHKNYDSGQNDDENHVNNASLAVVSLVALFSVLIVSEIVSVNEVKVDGIVVVVLRSGWHVDFRIEEGVEGVVGRPVGVGDGHVCARPELLLGTAANGSRAVPASAPVISCDVSPLKDALLACEI